MENLMFIPELLTGALLVGVVLGIANTKPGEH